MGESVDNLEVKLSFVKEHFARRGGKISAVKAYEDSRTKAWVSSAEAGKVSKLADFSGGADREPAHSAASWAHMDASHAHNNAAEAAQEAKLPDDVVAGHLAVVGMHLKMTENHATKMYDAHHDMDLRATRDLAKQAEGLRDNPPAYTGGGRVTKVGNLEDKSSTEYLQRMTPKAQRTVYDD
jgi:hypothetical protein